jgi:hypothetical protein
LVLPLAKRNWRLRRPERRPEFRNTHGVGPTQAPCLQSSDAILLYHAIPSNMLIALGDVRSTLR